MKMKLSLKSLDSKTYYDKDILLLHTIMQLVVDFIEIELAHFYLIEKPTLKSRLYKIIPRCLAKDDWVRSRELGLKYLSELQKFEKDLRQSPTFNKTLKEVYVWWKDVRPKRVDVETASGLIKCIKNPQTCNRSQFERAVKKAQKLEKKYFDEDTKMLKKIIDIREYLWV